MKFNVKYRSSTSFLAPKVYRVIVEAADMETCKTAINSWRVRELRLGNKFTIISITET